MGAVNSVCQTEESAVVTLPTSSSPSPPASGNLQEGTSLLREWRHQSTIHYPPVESIPRTPPPTRTLRKGHNSPIRSGISLYNKMTRVSYFRRYTRSKGFLYGCAIIYVVGCSIVSVLAPLLVNCAQEAVVSDFENPGYVFTEECHHKRYMHLLYMTPMECSFGRRIFFAAIFGGLIGWERRQADRPAGIRTMSLVSLGACLFSICGTFAFIDGPMGWDASRISAAVPSGVGFLGAGIIWKQTDKESNAQSVHGLTTAASLWLSAAVGIACAGELYFAASFSIAVMMILLRFGPRIMMGDELGFSSERDLDDNSDEFEVPMEVSGYRYHSVEDVESNDASTVKSPNRNSLRPKSRQKRMKDFPSIRE